MVLLCIKTSIKGCRLCKKKQKKTYHLVDPDSHNQFKPYRKFRDDFGDEGCNGISIVWFVELCLIQTVHYYDVIFFWNLTLCTTQQKRHGKTYLKSNMDPESFKSLALRGCVQVFVQKSYQEQFVLLNVYYVILEHPAQ